MNKNEVNDPDSVIYGLLFEHYQNFVDNFNQQISLLSDDKHHSAKVNFYNYYNFSKISKNSKLQQLLL